MAGKPLGGIGVLVTRPREQAQHLATLISQAGGVPVLFPALEIQPVGETDALNRLIDRLDQFHWAIFISPTAVEQAMNRVRARRPWPDTLNIAAVGKGSARTLRQFGFQHILAPEGKADSEALLALPEMDNVAGLKVVIFRGEGGRELLGKTLADRGAEISFAECYRRALPNNEVVPVLQRWARGEVGAVTVTSRETLHNLFDLLGKLGQQWLKTTPLFVIHERIAAAAGELGVSQAIVAGPDDEALVEGLIDWFKDRKTT